MTFGGEKSQSCESSSLQDDDEVVVKNNHKLIAPMKHCNYFESFRKKKKAFRDNQACQKAITGVIEIRQSNVNK